MINKIINQYTSIQNNLRDMYFSWKDHNNQYTNMYYFELA